MQKRLVTRRAPPSGSNIRNEMREGIQVGGTGVAHRAQVAQVPLHHLPRGPVIYFQCYHTMNAGAYEGHLKESLYFAWAPYHGRRS